MYEKIKSGLQIRSELGKIDKLEPADLLKSDQVIPFSK